MTPVFSIEEEIQLENYVDFLEKLSDIYYGKAEEQNSVSPFLRLFSQEGLKFNNSFINSLKLSFLFENTLSYYDIHNASPYLKNKIGIVEPMFSVKFNDNKTEFMFDYNLTRRLEGYHKGFLEKISRLYISHNITPNQTILIGQGNRVPINYDGSRNTMQTETVLKSQTGRTFANSFSTGIRNIASYKYIDYDIGIYDSTRYMKDFGNGIDFTGFAIIKPFINQESELYKNIKIGTGYAIGKNHINYHTYTAFASYDYKKFHVKAEYSNADGYNGITISRNKADGFYSLISYELTPKLEVLFKYDYFTPNKNISSKYSQEYTAGLTYKIFKNFKFIINYVCKINSSSPNSNMILFAARFII